jgi:hypothetical protein
MTSSNQSPTGPLNSFHINESNICCCGSFDLKTKFKIKSTTNTLHGIFSASVCSEWKKIEFKNTTSLVMSVKHFFSVCQQKTPSFALEEYRFQKEAKVRV